MSQDSGPPRMVFAGILVSLSVTAISQTFVTTALPTMVGDLGGFDGLSWIVGGYLLASTVVVPFAGKLADLYGSTRLFQIAIIVFAIGSIIAGRSTTVEMLVAARVLQGLGGGAILTLSFTLVRPVGGARERGRYQGYIASLFTVANVAGPVVGGFFVDHLSWRWLFYTTAAVCLIALLFVRRNMPSDKRTTSAPFDLAGSCLLIVSLVGTMLVCDLGRADVGMGVSGTDRSDRRSSSWRRSPSSSSSDRRPSRSCRSICSGGARCGSPRSSAS